MAIFPITEEASTPDIAISDRGANFLYDFSKNEFTMKDGKFVEVTGDAAVIFWIQKTLKTEFERATVYKETEYGSRLSSLVGSTLPSAVLESILEQDIKTALLQHERISSLDNFSFSKTDDVVNIGFRVTLNALTASDEMSASENSFTMLSTLQDIQDFVNIKLLTSNSLYFKTSINQQVYV